MRSTAAFVALLDRDKVADEVGVAVRMDDEADERLPAVGAPSHMGAVSESLDVLEVWPQLVPPPEVVVEEGWPVADLEPCRPA
jgi:hypothetical protein